MKLALVFLMNQALENLLRDPRIRRVNTNPAADCESLPTGFPALDEKLPGGGWPVGALTEILSEREGIGELRIVLSTLASLSREGRWIVWVAPPYVPYAPALLVRGVDLSRVLMVRADFGPERVWAAEQALRCEACGAVLLWPCAADERSLRRLQLAAETGKTWGVLFRTERAAGRFSPAALRLQLIPSAQGLVVRVLKCRGRSPSGPLLVVSS